MSNPHPDATHPAPVGGPPAVSPFGQMEPARVAGVRELFWQNVIREMLTSLSTAGMAYDAALAAAEHRVITTTVDAAHGRLAETEIRPEPPSNELFDGRLAVMTTTGTRIPIGRVMPLFACGIDTSSRERALSVAVECTVFQIRTPTGEVYTLPLHEIRGFHALTPELVEQLREQAAAISPEPDADEPFGFAAFTSLARDAKAEARGGGRQVD